MHYVFILVVQQSFSECNILRLSITTIYEKPKNKLDTGRINAFRKLQQGEENITISTHSLMERTTLNILLFQKFYPSIL